ncbi:MAG: 4Fe-4S dicluster domain-containing protein [Chloroflexi bacterium]|nr:MAG: 4Fe-4S dicluster domain-containing protein [Chloroflexota bacterium]
MKDQKVPSALAHSPEWRKIREFYTYLKPGLWLMRLPVIGPILQKHFIQENRDANWFVPFLETAPARFSIPVGEAIPVGHQQVLPVLVIQRLLEEADGIFAMAACPCRTAFRCQAHPWDLGCLHLGPAARGIPSALGRQLSLAEGLEHLRKAMTDGLIPTILYIPSEAEIFRVDKTRMLSICFCCECCCDVRLMMRRGPDRYWDLYNHRLPGLTISISSACTRCGACAQACYGGERVIKLGRERAEINERCIGCGRCVTACPEGAITLDFDPQVDWMQSLLERISQRAEIGPPPAKSSSTRASE